MGPFSIAVRQLKFLVVGIDYFTKWVEAKALAIITEKNIWSFVWKNIICRYRIPRVLVSDNGKQFNNNTFRDFCLELGDQEPLLITCPPTGQWTGRGYESILTQDHQDSA